MANILHVDRQNNTITLGKNDTPITISYVAAEDNDVDKFLVSSTGVIKYRTGAQVLLDIGGSASGHNHSGVYEPADAGLTSLAGLTYASDSFIKVTAEDTYAIRTFAETRIDLGLVIGTNVQAFGAVLDDLNTLGIVGANSEFLVGTGEGVLAWESGATVRTSLGVGTGDSPQFAGLTLTDDLILTAGTGIHSNTVDGSDNANIYISGGGAYGETRGASILCYGNEFPDTSKGKIWLRGGNVADGDIIAVVEATERGRFTAEGLVLKSGTLFLQEQATAEADTAAYGQLWVKNTDPNQLWFTDDDGTDAQIVNKEYVDDQITAHKYTHDGTQVFNTDAPTSFTNLDLSAYVGTNYSLVFLAIYNADATQNTTYYFRMTGHLCDVGSGGTEAGGCSAVAIDIGKIGYVVIATDADGIVQWNNDNAGVDTDVWIIGYVKS